MTLFQRTVYNPSIKLTRRVFLACMALMCIITALQACSSNPPFTVTVTRGPYQPEQEKVDERYFIRVTETRIELRSAIHFDSGQASIQRRSLPMLEEIADVLKENPRIHIRIEGHTDQVGSPESNQKLSENRANTVKNFLTQRGIDAHRLDAVGFGQRRPLTEEVDEETRAINRRVEIHITRR